MNKMRPAAMHKRIEVESVSVGLGQWTTVFLRDKPEGQIGDRNAQIELRVLPDGKFEIFMDAEKNNIVVRTTDEWYDPCREGNYTTNG